MWVPGIPVTQGSMRHRGKGRMAHDNEEKLKPWRAVVAYHTAEGWHGGPSEAAMSIGLRFCFRRPKTHYGTGRNSGALKKTAPKYPAGRRYDLDKLVRAVLDALTGVVYMDDGQVVDLGEKPHKCYAPDPGVQIIVRELLEDVS